MTNDYDAHAPRDLDQPQRYTPAPKAERVEMDAGNIRSRLINNLRASMADAQDLANVYDNLARQLELQIVLVDTKK